LSGDEIVFDEMKVREPERRVRPDRDRRFAALAYEVAGPDDLPIFIDLAAADAIERHALSDTSVELGGILLGKECLDPTSGEPFVWITQSLEAKHYANTQASFTYTHDSWEEITRERDKRYPESDIVGWYHTHPSFGIFLSHHDLFIHRNFFSQPLQVAYVVDPINQTRGFFQWRDGGMQPVSGYYVSAERGDRIALARLVNDLEQVPNPSPFGALSPRLEAELLKMLTRPSQREVFTSIDRAHTAGVFGLGGAVLGALAVAAGLWIYQLQLRLHEQNESLQALARTVEQSTAGQRLVSDAVLDKLGAENAPDFVARYDKAAKARDEARNEVKIQKSINDMLAGRVSDLETRAAAVSGELTEARKDIENLEKRAKDASKLEEQVATLEDTNARQKRDLDSLAPWLGTDQGVKATEMAGELKRTRLVAYAGWAVSALVVGIGLIVAFRLWNPLAEPVPEAPPEVNDRPTHRIE
jgi:proteasome lid subunit RPN8/RPN11